MLCYLFFLLATLPFLADDPAATKPDDAQPPAEAATYSGRLVERGSGEPVSGAKVLVRRQVTQGGKRDVLEETLHTSDADGRFEFSIKAEQAARPLLYVALEVTHDTHISRRDLGSLHTAIRQRKTKDESQFFDKIELVKGEAIRGHVENPDGRPAAGVFIQTFTRADGANFNEFGSFLRDETDAEGNFNIVIATPGSAVIWILPQDFAALTHVVKDRGDQGTFRVGPGVSLTGTARDLDGKAISNVWVSARRERGNPPSDAETAMQNLRVGDATARSALTNDEGEYRLRPLPPGTYRVEVSTSSSEPAMRRSPADNFSRPIPAVFMPERMTLDDSGQPHALDLVAVPHVTMEIVAFDSKGNPAKVPSIHYYGQSIGINSQFYSSELQTQNETRAQLRLPRDLQNVQLNIMGDGQSSIRHRLSKDAPLSTSRTLMLGTVSEEPPTLELIVCKSPTVLIRAVDAEGKTIDSAQVSGNYASGRGSMDGKYILDNGLQSDLYFNKQSDGRHKPQSMIPDEEVTFTIQASGYTSHDEVLTLGEGETKELTVVLEKSGVASENGIER